MRRSLLVVSTALAVLILVPMAAAVTSAVATVPVAVHPGAGGPGTTFAISLRIPSPTGTEGVIRRRDTLSVSGPGAAGCISSAVLTLPDAAGGTMVRMRLNPSRLGGHWCVGLFRGAVVETQSAVCGPGPARACPLLMIRPQTIARFRFRVRG